MGRLPTVVGVPVPMLQRREHATTLARLPQYVEKSAIVTVTAHATIHTKGSWSQLIASTADDYDFITVAVQSVQTNATDTRQLLDIGVGVAASEVVVLPNIAAGYAYQQADSYPIYIPKGSRVAARIQGLISGDTAAVILTCYKATDRSLVGPTYADNYGSDTANSDGTLISSTNTYVQITAATTQAYQALKLVFVMGPGNTFTDEDSVLSLAIGAAGLEQLVGTSTMHLWSQEGTWNWNTSSAFDATGLFVRHVPAGSRIAVKATTGRTYLGCAVLGFPY